MTYIHVGLYYGNNGIFPYFPEILGAEAHIYIYIYIWSMSTMSMYVYGHLYTDIVESRDVIATNKISLNVKII